MSSAYSAVQSYATSVSQTTTANQTQTTQTASQTVNTGTQSITTQPSSQTQTNVGSVYWAVRDLESSPVGNHHFVVITNTTGTIKSTNDFTTIGFFESKNGNLEVITNQASDVKAMQEILWIS